MRRFVPLIVLGITLFSVACGTLGQIAEEAASSADQANQTVIVVTATAENSAAEIVTDTNDETAVDSGADTVPQESPVEAPLIDDTSRLISVQARGVVRCGVNADLPGFGFYDAVRQQWSGFDVDFCKVIAAAVLGDASKVEYVAVTSSDGPNERFNAVRTGLVDVLIRNTSWTASRDGSGLMFGPTTFHDGQSFMVNADSGITTLADLEGSRICAGSGTTSLLNLRDDFAARRINFELVEIASDEDVYGAYARGECDAVTSDSSQLSVKRVTLADPDAHTVLGDRISREPLGPVVAEGDDQWYDIVSWAVYATMYAEELRIDRSNVDEFLLNSSDPRVRRLLGVEGDIGQRFGLPLDFGYQIISQVGNYADIYNDNLGAETIFAIDRGPNKAWNLGGGGVLASPPFR
jgi:general L-amino acid transport system substrate-binding protein